MHRSRASRHATRTAAWRADLSAQWAMYSAELARRVTRLRCHCAGGGWWRPPLNSGNRLRPEQQRVCRTARTERGRVAHDTVQSCATGRGGGGARVAVARTRRCAALWSVNGTAAPRATRPASRCVAALSVVARVCGRHARVRCRSARGCKSVWAACTRGGVVRATNLVVGPRRPAGARLVCYRRMLGAALRCVSDFLAATLCTADGAAPLLL